MFANLFVSKYPIPSLNDPWDGPERNYCCCSAMQIPHICRATDETVTVRFNRLPDKIANRMVLAVAPILNRDIRDMNIVGRSVCFCVSNPNLSCSLPMATPSFQAMPLEILLRIALGTIDCHKALVSLPLVSKRTYIASIGNLYNSVNEKALATLAQPSSASQEIIGGRHPAYYVEHIDISDNMSNDTFLTYFLDAFNNISRYANKKTTFTFRPFYLFDLNPVSTAAKLEYNEFESVSLQCSRPPVFGDDLFSALMTALTSERLKHLMLDFHMVSVAVNFSAAVKALTRVQLCSSSLKTLHLTFDALHQGSSSSMKALFNSPSFIFPLLEDLHVSDYHGDLDISSFLVRHPIIKRLSYVPGWRVDLSSFLSDPHVLPQLECLSGCGFVIMAVASHPSRPLVSIGITDWNPNPGNISTLIEGLSQIPTCRDFSLLLDDWVMIPELRQFQFVFKELRLFECNLLSNAIIPVKTVIESFYDVCTNISPCLSLLIVHTFCPKTVLLERLHRHAIDIAWRGRSMTTVLHIKILCGRAQQVLLELDIPVSSTRTASPNTIP
ncbi:hypothetical protein GG344DRAFT_82963 [Lentinula edodes]|nr:hypothetical protein GG344DRAFT_82963 [Lentinula edodes]